MHVSTTLFWLVLFIYYWSQNLFMLLINIRIYAVLINENLEEKNLWKKKKLTDWSWTCTAGCTVVGVEEERFRLRGSDKRPSFWSSTPAITTVECKSTAFALEATISIFSWLLLGEEEEEEKLDHNQGWLDKITGDVEALGPITETNPNNTASGIINNKTLNDEENDDEPIRIIESLASSFSTLFHLRHWKSRKVQERLRNICVLMDSSFSPSVRLPCPLYASSSCRTLTDSQFCTCFRPASFCFPPITIPTPMCFTRSLLLRGRQETRVRYIYVLSVVTRLRSWVGY